MKIPQTKRDDVADEIHGIKIVDHYRWLEDGNSKEVSDWINAQNQYTFSLLKNKKQAALADELVKNFKVTIFSNPIPIHGRYFYTERRADEDQAVLYYKDGLEGVPNKLVDPNEKRDGHTVILDYWYPGWTGKYVAYGLSEGGDEMATIYIMDVEKKENLSEKIIRCRYSSFCWLPDDSGFFYVRNARPGTVPQDEEHMHSKVYFHKLGDNPDEDKMIFGQGRPKDDMIDLALSMDGRYLAIHVARDWTANDVYIYDGAREETVPLVLGIPARFSLQFLADKAIIHTNYNASRGRIICAGLSDLFRGIESWEEFVPERENALEVVAVTADRIVLGYLVNACSEVIMVDHSGKEIGKLPLPQFSSLAGVSVSKIEKEFFFGVESFTFPKIIYRYDSATEKPEKYRAIDNPINPDDYIVKQEWYLGKDGARIPMFIFHKKEVTLDGRNPVLLYGYGGFACNVVPEFRRALVPWSEHGGVFVVANIRGGNEFGDDWHRAAIKENRQKSFDDFISAAEYLVSREYTDARHLGIIGASNGGLLVATVAIQRPDLFQAVCSKVPLTDMVRFPKFGMAIRWVHEYGDPTVKAELENILKWSPYHNVRDGVEYPNILFTTAEKDSRVNPLHSRKMAALLQSVNKRNKVLLFTEMDAGHGANKPVTKLVEEQSLILSFFAGQLELK